MPSSDPPPTADPTVRRRWHAFLTIEFALLCGWVTRTFRCSLGSSPLTGKQALDQATRFKAQLRSLQKKPDTVTLLTTVSVEAPHLSVVAMYDADDPCALEWVRQAEAVSAELWQKLAERRTAARGR